MEAAARMAAPSHPMAPAAVLPWSAERGHPTKRLPGSATGLRAPRRRAASHPESLPRPPPSGAARGGRRRGRWVALHGGSQARSHPLAGGARGPRRPDGSSKAAPLSEGPSAVAAERPPRRRAPGAARRAAAVGSRAVPRPARAAYPGRSPDCTSDNARRGAPRCGRHRPGSAGSIRTWAPRVPRQAHRLPRKRSPWERAPTLQPHRR